MAVPALVVGVMIGVASTAIIGLAVLAMNQWESHGTGARSMPDANYPNAWNVRDEAAERRRRRQQPTMSPAGVEDKLVDLPETSSLLENDVGEREMRTTSNTGAENDTLNQSQNEPTLRRRSTRSHAGGEDDRLDQPPDDIPLRRRPTTGHTRATNLPLREPVETETPETSTGRRVNPLLEKLGDVALELAFHVVDGLVQEYVTGGGGGRRTVLRAGASTQNGIIFIQARELQIAWGDDERYWQRTMENGEEVAELIQVSWLEVKKNISMNYLEAGREYHASFNIKLTDSARNLRDLKLALELPDGTRRERMVKNLIEIVPRGAWTSIWVAEFTATGHEGDIEVSLTNLEGEWKKGLMIAGIVIQPVI